MGCINGLCQAWPSRQSDLATAVVAEATRLDDARCANGCDGCMQFVLSHGGGELRYADAESLEQLLLLYPILADGERTRMRMHGGVLGQPFRGCNRHVLKLECAHVGIAGEPLQGLGIIVGGDE